MDAALYIDIAAAVFITIGFLFLMEKFGLVEKSVKAVKVSQLALNDIRNAELSERQKEDAMQQYAKQLSFLFISLLIRGAAAAMLPVLVVYLLGMLDLLSFEHTINITMSIPFLLSALFIGVAYFIVFKKRGSEPSNNSYSTTEKMLHYFSFYTSRAQVGIADMEDSMFKDSIENTNIDNPVFITALPRAGTTLLLETLSEVETFASHRYSDMPFVMVPLIWKRFSRYFRTSETLRERAHGDGILINSESPEAFEEIVWKTFWPKKYLSDRITPWSDEENKEFYDFYHTHIKKIIVARSSKDTHSQRYLSKNNLNISRIELIHSYFSDSIILIPYRHPVQHALSLLKQHKNFLSLHEKDSFAKTYMRCIGHFDFGMNLKPVNFDNWLEQTNNRDPLHLSFWIDYWCATYNYLLRNNSKTAVFFSFDQFCDHPEHSLKKLFEVLKIDEFESIPQLSGKINKAKPHNTNGFIIENEQLSNAETIYSRLNALSIV